MPVRKQFGGWGNFMKAMGRATMKWIPSLNGHTRIGSRNKSRKRVKNKFGYIEIYEPSHPEANKSGYVREHRMVMSDYLGRKLSQKEQVHHINGIKDDNRIENLMIIGISEHISLHHNGVKKPRKGSELCWYPSCDRVTRSRYGLCTRHYKQQWIRLKNGKIKSIYENPKLISK